MNHGYFFENTENFVSALIEVLKTKFKQGTLDFYLNGINKTYDKVSQTKYSLKQL